MTFPNRWHELKRAKIKYEKKNLKHHDNNANKNKVRAVTQVTLGTV